MPELVIYTESELLRRISEGDGKAFTILMREHSGFLYSYLVKFCKQKEMAEEVIQDIFTQLWLNRKVFSNIRDFRPYLLTISRNHAIGLLKRALREQQTLSEYRLLLEGPPEDYTLKEQRLRLIEAAVKRLPPQQKRIWELSRRGGKKYAEIAEELQLSTETVKKHLQYARKMITRYLKDSPEIILLLFVILLN